MVGLDDSTLAGAVALAAHDGELTLFAREWTGAIHLTCGQRRWTLPIVAGRLGAAVHRVTDPQLGPHDVHVSGDAVHFQRVLEPVPPPGYVDWFGAEYGGTMHVALGSPIDQGRY